MESGINGRNAVEQIVARRTDFLSDVSGLNTNIHPGDGMLSNDDVGLQYYFQCGRSALDLIDRSLLCADRPRHRIRNVLDFACGFGRVTRWLVAAFPHAEVVGCDVDARSVQAVRDNLGITAHVIKPDWSNVLHDRFDLIWVGSLFTHLSQAKSNELAKLLHRRLQAGGFLAFTTHGRYVVERIRSGENTYGAANAGQVVIDYDKVGYGFAPYQGMPHYGISATRVRNVDDMLAEADLRVLTYVERGWVKHQDFFSCCR